MCGNFINRHRLAHVQNQHLAVVANCAGLNNQLHGFRNGHEVTGNALVRDCDWATFINLIAERHQYAAARAQHVAEAHRDVLALASIATKPRSKAFGNALRVTKHADGVCSLVGRDIHKHSHVIFLCSLKQRQRAANVGLVCLKRVTLQQRQVFKCGCVKHHFRFPRCKDAVNGVGIAQVGKHGLRSV